MPVRKSKDCGDEVSPILIRRPKTALDRKASLESFDLHEVDASPSFKEASLKERTLVGFEDGSWKQSPENFANDGIDEASLLKFDEDGDDQKLAQRNVVR